MNYPFVVFKKRTGSLLLDGEGLSFEPTDGASVDNDNSRQKLVVLWKDVTKHQVSPATHPKALLRLLLSSSSSSSSAISSETNDLTFQLQSRDILERLRKDISDLLRNSPTHNCHTQTRKRPFPDSENVQGQCNHSLTRLSPAMVAVARSSLLASDIPLRTQHSHLVLSPNSSDDNILNESDFWNTHRLPLAYRAATIYGMAEQGRSSTIRSSLDIFSTTKSASSKPTTNTSDNKVTPSKSASSSKVISLGVEDIRQIFLMYPAVHKAYEEKVPLELSEEQFWSKYLASEFFHRDRGRLGSHFRTRDDNSSRGGDKETEKMKPEEHALTSNADTFSRIDMDIQQERTKQKNNIKSAMGTFPLARGQFDLASTCNTERGGKLLLLQHHGMEGANNINTTHSTIGDRIIDKYNRHWAIALNPLEAHAGSCTIDLARQSIHHVLDGDTDAKCGGGVDLEMQRLVRFASAKEDQVDHVRCDGIDREQGTLIELSSPATQYRDLKLKNIHAYSGTAINPDTIKENGISVTTHSATSIPRHVLFSKMMLERMKGVVTSINLDTSEVKNPKPDMATTALPEPTFGREILKALTKRMVEDSISEEDAMKITHQLPKDFIQQVGSYFRRCSELLRHFFALRRVLELEKISSSSQGSDRTLIHKSKKIIKAMEDVYREMESIRNGLPQSDMGETMRKIYLSIMNQLDWAFKLNRDSSSSGGFVSVDD